jgi:multiple sugar transport system permease protein
MFLRLSDRNFGLLLLLPSLLLISVLIIYPAIFALDLSFESIDLATGARTFQGMRNYGSLVRDAEFWASWENTLLFTGAAVCLELVIGLCLALLLNSQFRGRNIFRGLLTLPLMVAPIVVGLQWRWLLMDPTGPVNAIIRALGFAGPSWLGDPLVAMWSIIIADLWQATPFDFLVMLAALQTVPQDQCEAASIDGASSPQVFRYVTLPCIVPSILVVLLIRSMDAFRIFDIVYIMTGGGPAGATNTVAMYIYRRFTFLDFGRSSAASFVVLATIVMVGLFLIRIFRAQTQR